jgi:hypothetical protein
MLTSMLNSVPDFEGVPVVLADSVAFAAKPRYAGGGFTSYFARSLERSAQIDGGSNESIQSVGFRFVTPHGTADGITNGADASTNVEDWLLDGLARYGALDPKRSLVCSHIITPSVDYVPDTWQPTAVGAGRLLSRLLAFAGLGHLQVHVAGFTEANATEFDFRGHAQGHGGGTAAWFAGIDDRNVYFGVNERELRHADLLIGTLGHEVAHAYRYHHDLVVPTRDVEEQLTDLTAIGLGFGVFLVNSSAWIKSGGVSAAGDPLLFERGGGGYLAPSDLAFLLAAQCAVRELEPSELKRVRRELTADHREPFVRAYERLARDPAALRQRLGLPDPEDWPAAPSLVECTRPLSDPIEFDPAAVSAEYEPSAEAQGLAESSDGVTFRVRRSGLVSHAVVAVVGLVVASSVSSDAVWLGAALVLAILVVWRGWRARADHCAISECGAEIPPSDSNCPWCGCHVEGRIGHESERLAAEEALGRD